MDDLLHKLDGPDQWWFAPLIWGVLTAIVLVLAYYVMGVYQEPRPVVVSTETYTPRPSDLVGKASCGDTLTRRKSSMAAMKPLAVDLLPNHPRSRRKAMGRRAVCRKRAR